MSKGGSTIFKYTIIVTLMLCSFKTGNLQNYANYAAAGVNSEVYYRTGGNLTK